MKQSEMYIIKDGLHESGVMGRNRVIRGQMVCTDFLVFMRDPMINTNVRRTLRKLCNKTFQKHSHLTFSERVCVAGVSKVTGFAFMFTNLH